MTNKFRASLVVAIATIGGLFVVLAPSAAYAKTTLVIVKGSKEFQTFETSTTLSSPEDLYMQWTTDQAGATGGTWQVTNVTAGNKVVASGEAGPAPTVGYFARFTIAANAFLQSLAPATPVKFNITIVAHNAAKQPLGSPSSAVEVDQVPNGPPQPPIVFGPGAVFPSVEMIKYDEKVGVVPLTQLQFAGADVTVRVSNKGRTATSPIWLNIKDDNVLMRQASPVSVASLKAGDSKLVIVHVNAVLPPPTSQLPEDKQYSQWFQEYNDRCGVDLSIVMDWKGPQAQTPIDNHTQAYLYQGFGSSKPWQEGISIADTVICDDKNCVSINQVARSVYKQIACKVVGYALFVGDKVTGPRSRFDAFGKARKSINPPETDFSPTTKMQIASSSKVLTGLATIRVMGNKIDSPAFTSFPSNWTLPQNTIVKNITPRQLVSQTSGVQQYYAGNNGQDFASLQTFFTQTISNPNAPRTCPGSCVPPNPRVPGKCASRIIPNPIVMNLTFCYTDTNFGVMRLVLPRFAGANTNDPLDLAKKYVDQVRANVFTPLGVQNVGCQPPPSPSDYAFLYSWGRPAANLDWGDTRLSCGDWGWYVSVQDYAKVLVSLNSADHKILSDCQFEDMETNPSTHPIGWDITSDGAGHRWLEKNGAQGGSCDANGKNCATQTTSVGIFGGRSGCANKGTSPMSGVAGVLFINSDISGQPNSGASAVLIKAFQDSVKPKP